MIICSGVDAIFCMVWYGNSKNSITMERNEDAQTTSNKRLITLMSYESIFEHVTTFDARCCKFISSLFFNLACQFELIFHFQFHSLRSGMMLTNLQLFLLLITFLVDYFRPGFQASLESIPPQFPFS